MNDFPKTANLPDDLSWTVFLERYANGDWPGLDSGIDNENGMPLFSPTSESSAIFFSFEPPPGVRQAVDEELPLSEYEKRLYPSVSINNDTARAVQRYMHLNDYLPPPRSPLEHRRLECIQQYDINGPVQLANIQRAVNVVSAFFPGAIITYTQFEGKTPMYLAAAGDKDLIERFGIETHIAVSPSTAICGHTVLLRENLMFVPDLENDIRFRSNPATRAGAKSYIGSPIFLPLETLPTSSSKESATDDSNPHSFDKVGIGALNVLFVEEPHGTLSSNEALFVEQIARLLESQLRSTWQSSVTKHEFQKRAMVSQMVESTFVVEQISRQEESASPSADAVRLLKDRDVAFKAIAGGVVERLSAVLSYMTGIGIVDVADGFNDQGQADQPYRCTCIAQHFEGEWAIPTALPSAVLTKSSQRKYFSLGGNRSGLESSLPEATGAHIIMPFFSSDRPQFAIIATSSRLYISRSDIAFVRTVGSLLLARRVADIAIEADYTKSTFLSTMTHELRTPLYTIISNASLAKSALNDRQLPDANAAIDAIQSSGFALQTLMNDVLDYGQPDTTIIAHDASQVVIANVVSLIKDAVKLAMTLYCDQERGFSFRLNYDAKRDWTASISAKAYTRVLLNGITNALKFCRNDAISISLATTPDGTLVTNITDRGIGLDEEQLPFLFRAFTKAHDYTPGAGLGLHISQRLVHEMGGFLNITSNEKTGTAFQFSLPSVMRNPSSPSTNSSVDDVSDLLASLSAGTGSENSIRSNDRHRNSTPTPSPPLPTDGSPPMPPIHSLESVQPLRVLVVDDNALCRRILIKTLKRFPVAISTIEACDGQEALEHFPSFAPHLVLTDVSMPIMDGVTSAQHMRRITTERQMEPCKIYAISGLGLSDPRLKAAGLQGSAELDGWLVKGQDDLAAVSRIVADLWEVQTLKTRTDTGV